MLSAQSYFKDSWNTFDFVTVVGSIVDALMVEFAVSIAFIIHTYVIHTVFPEIVSGDIKVEKILKSTLDSIQSPSVKIQIMGGKSVKANHCWVIWAFFLFSKVC